MNYFVHQMAICESKTIGPESRIWAFAHVLPGATVGANCNICDHVFIENDVILGDRVTVKCGVQLWDGMRVENDVFIGPNVTFTNDRFPRSKQSVQYPLTQLRHGCSIGANATLLPGITIGRNAMIGAGSVVTKSVPPNAVVRGNPARIHSYTSTLRDSCSATPVDLQQTEAVSGVRGVTLHRLPAFDDIRGSLIALQLDAELPFRAVRLFVVYGVPSSEVRGEHAHRRCHQFLVCMQGSVNLLVDDGSRREEFLLNTPNTGVHIPPLIWGTQYRYSPDAVLLVLASHPYDADDYIRDYDTWLGVVEKKSSSTNA